MKLSQINFKKVSSSVFFLFFSLIDVLCFAIGPRACNKVGSMRLRLVRLNSHENGSNPTHVLVEQKCPRRTQLPGQGDLGTSPIDL